MPNTQPIKIGILGAGASGLFLHHFLKKELQALNRPFEIHVFEKSNRAGGVIWTEHKDQFTLEHGPDCFLSEKKSLIELSSKLGLGGELVSTQEQFRRSYILKSNKLHAVPEGLYLMAPTKLWPFALSPLLSFKGKIRALQELFIPKKMDFTQDESLASFVRRRFGEELLEGIAQPMIAGIYTADPETLSLRATMPRFLDLEEKYGSVIRGMLQKKLSKGTSGPRYSLFVSYKNGMATLTDRLIQELDAQKLHLDFSISHLIFTDNSWKVTSTKDESQTVDYLISCLPAYEIMKALPPNYQMSYDETPEYASTAILHAAFETRQLKHGFNGMGFVVPHREKKAIMACSFLSHKFAGRAPKDHTLVRIFCGGKLNENLMSLSDEDLATTALSELKSILNIDGAPLFVTAKRWMKRMPQYTLGHIERTQKVETHFKNIPNFFATGNYFNGVGLPDVAERARNTAQSFIKIIN